MKRTAVEQPHLSSAKVSTDAHSATLYLPTVKSVPGHATWLSLNCKVSLAAEQVCARTPGPGAAHRRSAGAAVHSQVAKVRTRTWGNTHKHAGSDKIQSVYMYLVQKAQGWGWKSVTTAPKLHLRNSSPRTHVVSQRTEVGTR